MSESISSPWICDYFVDVAETHGAQLFNAPVSSSKKKVQLTDFLTYQEDSYVWAWISDKHHRVSVRISRDAADLYKSNHGRNIIDCRFSVVSISSYRPMFSPRPLGPNATGNTPVYHLSLEIGHVKSVGVGGHLFGNPHDLESDKNMKEWVLGLRQDGGGGNVLKLRKQQELVQNKKIPPSPPPPPLLSLHAPVSQCQAIKPAEDVAKPKPEQPQDFKRAYTKRWRIVEVKPWKFALKPATEERPNQPTHVLAEPPLDTTSRLESRHREPLVCPTSPLRTPSPISRPQRQGTPTDWSPSNRGSPVTPDKATTIASGNGIRQHDEPEVLPTTPHLPSDTEEHATADIAMISDTHSLQPPTPAQRIKHSPPPRFTSPPRSPLEVIAPSSPLSSQQFPCSSPPPPSSSLPLLSSSLPMATGIRKNIQRKVPHPGFPVARPDPTKQGPVRILVPNSDTSGTGSSQSYSQPQLPSQLQQLQRQLLSYSPALPSSLVKDFKPPDTSTPREGMPDSSTRRTPKMFAASLPTHCDEQEIASTHEKYSIGKSETNIGKQERPGSSRPPAPSTPKIEVLEVGTSDTEEETDQLQLTHTTARTEVDLDTQPGKQESGSGDADANHEDNRLSVDKVEVYHPTPQSSPPRRPSCQPATSVIQHPSSSKQDTDGLSTRRSPQSPEYPVSRSSMHSLFSDSLGDERSVSSRALPGGQTEVKVQEKASPTYVPRHDAEAWKEPSFLARKKGKGKALTAKEPDTPSVKVAKKRRLSAQSELPVPKRAKVAATEGRRVALGQTTTENVQPQSIDVPATGKIRSSDRPSTSPADTTERIPPPTAIQSSKPRLASLIVDFERIDLSKRVPILQVDMDKDIKGVLLRTGRIRTLGQDVEKNGNVYIMIK